MKAGVMVVAAVAAATVAAAVAGRERSWRRARVCSGRRGADGLGLRTAAAAAMGAGTGTGTGTSRRRFGGFAFSGKFCFSTRGSPFFV